MKSVLSSLLLLALLPQSQTPVVSSDESPVTVVSFKWFKDRQAPAAVEAPTGPAPAMIPQNKNFERNRRANVSPGDRDPNLDTLDGRSSAMERAVQESRGPKTVDGFAYRTKIHNSTSRPIEVIFWEYQFKPAPDAEPLLRRQFLCGVAVKPEKDKELQAFSLTGPQSVITVDMLSKKGAPGTEAVVINRIEFADGSIWQRRGWNFGEVRMGYARAVATPWGNEMCRGL